MGLSLVAPAMLGLVLFVGLPILAHLSMRSPRTRHPFGAMLLLQRVNKRLQRRRRVHQRKILALRVLALLGFIFALAGLTLVTSGDTPEHGGSGKVVVVIDQSMSMSQVSGSSTLLARARDEATALLRALPSGAMVGLVSYGAHSTRLTPSLTANTDSAIRMIETIQPTSEGSNLRDGLLTARTLLGGDPGEVVVFTDEAGVGMIPAARSEIEALVEAGSVVIPMRVYNEDPVNLSVNAAKYGQGVEGGEVSFEVSNYGADDVETLCSVSLPDGAEINVFAMIGAHQSVRKSVTVPREADGGVGVVTCKDDALSLDNSRYFHLPRIGASKVLVVDGDPGDTPIKSEVYFLERALSPWGGGGAVIKPDVVPPVRLSRLDPEEHSVLFLANLSDPRPYAQELTNFVRKGGAVVISVGDNVTASRYNAALGSVNPVELLRPRTIAGSGEDGLGFEMPDVSTPLFAPFGRSGRAEFEKVQTSRMMTVAPFDENSAPDISVLMRFRGGAPAMVKRKVGAGAVVYYLSTFDLGWGDLPLQSLFMPLVQQLVKSLGGAAGGAAVTANGTVGSVVTVELPDIKIDPVLFGPDGEQLDVKLEGRFVKFTPRNSGAYSLGAMHAPASVIVAVNTPYTESDVNRHQSILETEAEIAPALFEKEHDLMPWALWLALVALVAQAIFSRRRADEVLA